MTQDEKRQQKALLLLEHQEAGEELAHLRERAGRLSTQFTEVGQWLSSGKLGFTGVYGQERRTLDASIRSNLASYRDATSFDDALKVMDEIVEAERKLDDLAKRKEALGLK